MGFSFRFTLVRSKQKVLMCGIFRDVLVITPLSVVTEAVGQQCRDSKFYQLYSVDTVVLVVILPKEKVKSLVDLLC